MRITSWNCHHGECRDRGSRIDELHSDLILLQECEKPTSSDNQCIWFETLPKKGVGVMARGPWHVEDGRSEPSAGDLVYPVKISGPLSIHLLAVWALPEPTYVRAILEGLNCYREFLKAAPALVVGDFNSPRNDRRSRADHLILEERLRSEFGLVSAFRTFAARTGDVAEPPTLYWQWREHQPFHIDYCFFPEKWTPQLRSVEISSYANLATESDHRPLTVEFEETESEALR